MSVYLIVKSDTSQIDSEDFDYWYENEHLYEAKKQFMAKNAMNSKKLQSLIKKFDQKWDFKVVRTRELVNLTQII